MKEKKKKSTLGLSLFTEEGYKVTYLTSWERIAIKEGRKEGKKIGRIEGRIEGREEGRKIGRKEGMKEAKREVAQVLVKRGVDMNLIAEVTGLSRREIEKLPDKAQ